MGLRAKGLVMHFAMGNKFGNVDTKFELAELYVSLAPWSTHAPVGDVIAAVVDVYRAYVHGDIDGYNRALRDARAEAIRASDSIVDGDREIELGVYIARIIADLDRIADLPGYAVAYLGAIALGRKRHDLLRAHGSRAWGLLRCRRYNVEVVRVAGDGRRERMLHHSGAGAWSAWRMFWDYAKSQRVHPGAVGALLGRAFVHAGHGLVMVVSTDHGSATLASANHNI